MHTLQKMFPSLTKFSDIDWELITQEYETTSIDISFPEYLQKKAEDGDCPPYLFELAYYELAIFDAKNSREPFPFKPGLYLNPTALFLNLEFDIPQMLKGAEKGEIEVYEKSHILCIYRDADNKVKTLELDDDSLEILQGLEDGPQMDNTFVGEKKMGNFQTLIKQGLILDLTNS